MNFLNSSPSLLFFYKCALIYVYYFGKIFTASKLKYNFYTQFVLFYRLKKVLLGFQDRKVYNEVKIKINVTNILVLIRMEICIII